MTAKLKDALLTLLLLTLLFPLAYLEARVFVPRDMFRWQGYDVGDNVEFTRIKKRWWERAVYRSSTPIALTDGTVCELWEVRRWGQTAYTCYVVPVTSE